MPILPKKSGDTSGASANCAGPALLRDGAVYARWYVMLRLREEIERARRYRRPLSILVAQPTLLPGEKLAASAFDSASAAARATARTTDLAGRLSGDGIIIVLPETAGDDARLAAARLRDEMYLRSRSQGGQKWSISVVDEIDEVAAAFGRADSGEAAA